MGSLLYPLYKLPKHAIPTFGSHRAHTPNTVPASLFLVSFTLPTTLRLVSRVDGQRVTLRHVSNRPPPNLCLHVSAHTALQTWSVVCLDRLSPVGSRPPPHGRGHLHRPAALPRVSSITLSIWDEVGRQRGTDAIPTFLDHSRWYPECGPFVRIGRSLRSFPPSKRSMRLSPHCAFQYTT